VQQGKARRRARLRADVLVNGFSAWSVDALRFTYLSLGRFAQGAVVDVSTVTRGMSVPAASGSTDNSNEFHRFFCSARDRRGHRRRQRSPAQLPAAVAGA
jgi:hypothetical protein